MLYSNYSAQIFVIMNQCRIIYILYPFIQGDKILRLYILLTFSSTKLTSAGRKILKFVFKW
jgi:hypothetical protein